MIPSFQLIKGGVTTPAGFKAAAHRAGIKVDAPDMALLVSDVDAAVAGTIACVHTGDGSMVVTIRQIRG